MSVILPAPAVFRLTYPSAPARHRRAAELLGWPVDGLDDAGRREALPRALIALMRDVGLPSGLRAIGYGEGDVPRLIEGTLKQPRLLAGAPRAIGAADLDWILRDRMSYWLPPTLSPVGGGGGRSGSMAHAGAAGHLHQSRTPEG